MGQRKSRFFNPKVKKVGGGGHTGIMEGSKMISLLDLLEETTIIGRLLSDLGWNDLIRFRRVCKATRDAVNKYIKNNPELAPELEIHEEDPFRRMGDFVKMGIAETFLFLSNPQANPRPTLNLKPQDEYETRSLTAFLKMGIPSTKIFLNNVSGHKFFTENWEDLSKFLQEYGSKVKSLRVKELSMYLHGREWDFLDGLENLESYQASAIGVGEQVTDDESLERCNVATQQLLELARKDRRFAEDRIPAFFGKLKVLKIGSGIENGNGLVLGNMINRFYRLINAIPRVEHLAHPFGSQVGQNALIMDSGNVLGPTFAMIQAHIMKGEVMPEANAALKTFDFCGFHDDPNLAMNVVTGSEAFLRLCDTCLKNNVKLFNVAANWFDHRLNPDALPELTRTELGKVVVSLINVRTEMLTLDMPNLERIEVRDASKCEVDQNPGQERPEWPALKSLDITMYHKKAMLFEIVVGRDEPGILLRDVKDVFNFFFRDVRRLSVVELRLNFAGKPKDMEAPNTEDIVNACPNLKKLTIIKWPGSNKELSMLWIGLPALEEVTLEDCSGIGNDAFVGEDQRKPAFLELKKLKKLTLNGLDVMPKITDILFSLVIRRMSLTHFTVTSTFPVKSLTALGVESLLNGPFAQSIQKFSFRTWNLAVYPEKEWDALEKKFRSYDLL